MNVLVKESERLIMDYYRKARGRLKILLDKI